MNMHELLAALRSATGPSRELDAEIEICVGGGEIVWKTTNYTMEQFPAIRRPSKHHLGGFANEHCPLLTASLDAAVAFTERMLPGWGWRLTKNHATGLFEARGHNVIHAGEYAEADGFINGAMAMDAFVIAALIAQEEQ